MMDRLFAKYIQSICIYVVKALQSIEFRRDPKMISYNNRVNPII